MKERKVPAKSTLKGKIIGIVGCLVFAGILQIFWGAYIFRYYKNQNKQMELQIGEVFLTEQDSMFHYLNKEVQQLLYDGSEFRRMQEACSGYDPDFDIISAVEHTNSVLDVKEVFRRLATSYGSELNFFYYNFDTQAAVEFGTRVAERQAFALEMSEKIENGEIPVSRDGRWQMYEGKYLCLFNRGKMGYAACFMAPDNFTEQIMKMIPGEGAKVELCDRSSGLVFVEERNQKGEIRYYTRDGAPDETGWRNMKYADFGVRIQITENAMTKPIILQIVFAVVFVVYLGIVFFVLLYTKRNVLGQVSLFRENLLQFADNMRIDEESGIVEFAEAGKVLNQLADEINRLKIDVYEQQLQKKRVELDYAQLQIRPHFFTNCLSVMDSLADMGKTEQIKQISRLVSDYLRGTFRRSMKPVSLSEELAFVKNYLSMFGCIHGVECPLSLSVDETLDDFQIPPLLIQTFVENSIKYGREEEDVFEIHISARRAFVQELQTVEIVIRDFGRGMPEEVCALWNQGEFLTEDERYHVGVRNAVQRMQMMYGDNSGIRFSSREGTGLAVTIVFGEREREVWGDEDSFGG